MAVLTWVNGQDTSHIEVTDRGVQYGDGFFSTLYVFENSILNWSAHWQRVQESTERLGFPALDESTCWQMIQACLSSSQAKTLQKAPAVLKWSITRGQGGRGYLPPDSPNLTHILQLSTHPVHSDFANFEQFAQPMVIEHSLIQATIQPQLAGLKHLNRLENVLARQALLDADEALMFNAFDELVCATQANVFVVFGRTIKTPNLTHSGVNGTTRRQLPILLSRLGLEYKETQLSLEDVLQADEVFLTNALRGIMPVKSFLEKTYESKVTQTVHQAWVDWQKQNAKSLCLGFSSQGVEGV